MTVFALVFSLALVALLAVLMVAMPAIAPRGIPLGVAVPRDHLDDPAVRTALTRFRIGQVAAAVIAAGATLVLAFTLPLAAAMLPVLVFLVLSTVVYVLARRGIRAAKEAGDWYADVPLRMTADVAAPAHHRPPVAWLVAGAVVLVIAAGIGVALYPHLPASIPVHFGGNGVPDRYEPKSPLSVFTTLIIGGALLVLLGVVSALIARSGLRANAGDDPDAALAAAGRRRGILAAMVAELAAALSLSLAVLSVLTWTTQGSPAFMLVGILLPIALIVLVMIVAAVRFARVAGAAAPEPSRGRAARPDDDAHWKGGFLYVNHDDPAVFVPKRFGLGWTINAGHPAGVVMLVITALVLVGVIVAAVLGIRAR